MKKILFIFSIIAIYSCSSIRKNVQYRLYVKKGKSFYPYNHDLSIKLTSDTSGIFTNIRSDKDTIMQKFTYHNKVNGNEQIDIFRIVKYVDNYSVDRVLLKQNDTLIFYRKGIYFRFNAPNTTQHLLYFKR